MSTVVTQLNWMLKMCDRNAYHPQTTFPDVITHILNIYHPHPAFLGVVAKCLPPTSSISRCVKCVHRMCTIITQLFWMSNTCTEHQVSSHTISGCQNVYPERPPSSNSFFRYKNGCTEHITQPFQMSKHRYSMSTIPLSACIKHPQSVISEVKEHLLKLNHPHPPSNSSVVMSKHVYRMSTRRQNACPKVYNSHTVFPDVKMPVPNVYHPHPAFLDVQTNVPNVCHPPHSLSGWQNTCQEDLPSLASCYGCQNLCHKCLPTSYSISGC